jgi:hypothetical protein
MDPMGDYMSAGDIVQVAANVVQNEIGTGARIRITYAQNVVPPLVGYIFIDLDRNPATSIPSVSAVPGIDALVKFKITSSHGDLSFEVEITTAGGTDVELPPKSNLVILRINDDSITIILSKDLFGGRTVFDFFVCSSTQDPGGSFFDRVPDYGLIDFSTSRGQVKVSNPGNSAIDAMVTKAAQSMMFPNLTGLHATVVGDRLQVQVSYSTDVETGRGFPAGATIEGHVYLDTDHRLATGFANAGESPPSWGVDYALYFRLNPRRPFSATLQSFTSRTPGRSAPKELGMGLAFMNDCLARPLGNQVSFDLPLSLLGNSSGDADVRVDSSSAATQMMDILPSQGSLVTALRRIRPVFACTTPAIMITNPRSTAPGDKNDKLLGASACLSLGNDLNGDLLLLKIDYSLLQKSRGTATTNIYLDIDQNPATGMAVSNSDKTIGADYILSYSINLILPRNELVFTVQLMKAGNPAMIYNQLTTPTFGAMGYTLTSIPLDLLNHDDGNMDVLVETVNGSTRLDIAPKNGVFRVVRP